MLYLLSRPAVPKSLPFASISELVQQSGVLKVAKALGIAYNTLQVRMRTPGSFTLDELTRLAELVETDLLSITRLAQKDMDNQAKPTTDRPTS